MDKEMYKQMIAEYMRRESELKNKIESLNKQILELHMENAELKDMVLDSGGTYAETDGYEVGSPSDYKEDPQLNLFDERPMIYESPDGGKTIYGRRAGDKIREQFNRECD